ncbi:MAG: energy transducer TonB [Bacteroidota bacterium]
MKSRIYWIFALILILPSFLSAQNRIQSTESLPLYEQEPQPLNLAELRKGIPYPKALRQAGVEGMVQVMVKVDAQGNYLDHRIARSSHPLLSGAVNPYISCLTFTPAMNQGRPVVGWKAIPLRFRIRPSQVESKTLTVICPRESVGPQAPIAKTY